MGTSDDTMNGDTADMRSNVTAASRTHDLARLERLRMNVTAAPPGPNLEPGTVLHGTDADRDLNQWAAMFDLLRRIDLERLTVAAHLSEDDSSNVKALLPVDDDPTGGHDRPDTRPVRPDGTDRPASSPNAPHAPPAADVAAGYDDNH